MKESFVTIKDGVDPLDKMRVWRRDSQYVRIDIVEAERLNTVFLTPASARKVVRQITRSLDDIEAH